MHTLLTPRVARAPRAALALALLAGLVSPACRTDAPAHGAEPGRAPEAARDAVAPMLEVVREQERAWNRGSVDDFMAAGYWNSDELTFLSGGDWTRGYAPVLERYRRRYQAEGRQMGRLSFTDLEALRLAPDIGIVRGRWRLDFDEAEPMEGLMTLVMERLPEAADGRGGWRIVHDHTSLAPTPDAN